MTPTLEASPESNVALTDDSYANSCFSTQPAQELTLTDVQEQQPPVVDFVTRFNGLEVRAKNLAPHELVFLEWAVDNLAEYFYLRPDWDSYGGTTLSPKAASLGTQFLLQLGRKGLQVDRLENFRFLPLSDGGLQVEFYRADTELEITFHPSGDSDFFLETGDAELDGELEENSIDILASAISA